MRLGCAARIFALIAGLGFTGPALAADAQVFAAASLVDVLDDLAQGFEKATGKTVEIVPGSSSTLARQVLSGAPADVFISANKDYAEMVAEDLETEAYDLFGNSLAIIAPDSFEGATTLDNLPQALGKGRLAVGDPAHVPAGIYARQALENAGLWQKLEDRLAPAADVRAAVAFVVREAAPFGIVYKTDANVEGVKIVGTVDDALHEPIRYWGLETDPENAAGQMFLTYIVSFEGQNILEQAGFKTVISQ